MGDKNLEFGMGESKSNRKVKWLNPFDLVLGLIS